MKPAKWIHQDWTFIALRQSATETRSAQSFLSACQFSQDRIKLKESKGGIMHAKGTFLVALLVIRAVVAQTSTAELRSKTTDVRYAPLAEQARIQGDVHLRLAAGVVTVISGHPLLAETAVKSAKSFGSKAGLMDVDLTYHFVLVDTATSVPTWVTVRRGNGFERAILRMFGLKTEKVMLDYVCEEGVPPANDLKFTGATIEIWIYGRTRCLQTEAAELLARR